MYDYDPLYGGNKKIFFSRQEKKLLLICKRLPQDLCLCIVKEIIKKVYCDIYDEYFVKLQKIKELAFIYSLKTVQEKIRSQKTPEFLYTPAKTRLKVSEVLLHFIFIKYLDIVFHPLVGKWVVDI